MEGLVLASASPARLRILREAGLAVTPIVSGVDESGVSAPTTSELVCELAVLKAEAVFASLGDGDVAVLGCDSLLELDGLAQGKPADRADAVAVWRRMRGRSGVLFTGHHLVVRSGDTVTRQTRAAASTVHFAELSDAEIDAYVATGEPDSVAGAFTIDGVGGAFITGIEGDPHTVIGVSLPLLRVMLGAAGVAWTQLWRPELRPAPSPAG